MYLKYIQIVNFKNLKSARFEFSKGANTIIGENDSGKSNALTAMRILLDDSYYYNAKRLKETDFSYALGDWKGHWIIISAFFDDISVEDKNNEFCAEMAPEKENYDFLRSYIRCAGEGYGTVTLFIRPCKSKRLELSEASNSDRFEVIRSQIRLSDYEFFYTSRSQADFTNEVVYKSIVGDIAAGEYVNPENDDSFVLGTKIDIMSVWQHISTVFIDALRDVESELRKPKNPIRQIVDTIESEIDVTDIDDIKSKIAALNIRIANIPQISNIGEKVNQKLLEMIGTVYSPDITLESRLKEDFATLARYLTMTPSDQNDIDLLGLGHLNILYIALKLVEFEANRNRELLNIMIIEEPEAHIHTHIQKTLFANLQVTHTYTQVIMSTHSTHLSEVADIEKVNVIMKANEQISTVMKPTNGLDEFGADILKHKGIAFTQILSRYLDAKRSVLLFSKGVILVEGDGEEILIPALVKKVLGVSLDEMGIGLINIGSVAFENVACIFDEARLQKRCAIITDLDEIITGAALSSQIAMGLGAARKKRLSTLFNTNCYVEAFYASHTLEVDFANLNENKEFILDKQIRDTIKQFMQVGNTVAWAERSGDLRDAIKNGKRIIVTTIEKFPFVVPDIGAEHKDHIFTLLIDEAHSGQSGRNSAQMNLALSGLASEDEMDNEDKINAMMEGRKLLQNASYFAFTATPKNKTLETFGTLVVDENGNPILNEKGELQHRPFHVYTMKQAIQEGFILDVLKYYTPIDSYYKLMKTVDDDPMFDKKRAQKKLRAFVESDSYTISQKAEMMVEHFHEQVIAKGKIGGQARAMVVTASIARCVEYYYAINKCLAARHSPYKTIVAFSGEHKYQGQEPALTSAAINGFSDAEIPDRFAEDPYRLLVVADMFQTGFDEPLLHTMYVDKMLYDIKAVQTLSRLNRACPKKYDTFVLDFANKTSIIEAAFSRYYRTTILSGETDPNKLYDIIALMESYQVYSQEHVNKLVDLYLNGAERDRLDPILDACTAVYTEFETEDQIKFKSAAKSFCRTYGFLGAILPYGNVDWEKLSIFLNLLILKLPSPREDDLSQGILEAIDLDSYRLEAQEALSIKLEDEDAVVGPVPAGKIGYIVDPEMDLLSAILSAFNDMFGNINWNDADNVRRQILEIPAMVAKDESYQFAMRNSDAQNARLESERALQQVIFSIMADNMELFKQFQDNPSFKKWLSDMVFNLTYNPEGKPYQVPPSDRKK